MEHLRSNPRWFQETGRSIGKASKEKGEFNEKADRKDGLALVCGGVVSGGGRMWRHHGNHDDRIG
jgi:hypothetical protein